MYVLIKWYDSHRKHVENCYWITNFVILIIMAMAKRLFCSLRKKGFPFRALRALCSEGITRKCSLFEKHWVENDWHKEHKEWRKEVPREKEFNRSTYTDSNLSFISPLLSTLQLPELCRHVSLRMRKVSKWNFFMALLLTSDFIEIRGRDRLSVQSSYHK